MADYTWKTYKTAVESFQSFHKLYNLQDTWPAPPYECNSTLHTCLTQACQPVPLLLTFPV
jgi:hypothetical protein